MKKYFALLLLLSCLLSCNKDFGSVEVTYKKATAIYGDIDAVRQTPLSDGPKSIENPGKIFVADHLILIGEEEKGIHVIDNTNPTSPQNVSFITIPNNREFFVKMPYLYAESQYDMLKIDISNPNQPILISRIEEAIAEEMTNERGETLIGFNFETVTEKFKVDTDVANTVQNDLDNYIYFDYARQIIPTSAVPASFAGNSGDGNGSVNRIAVHNEHVYAISRSHMTVYKDGGSFEKVSDAWLGSDMETIFPHNKHLFIGSQSSMTIYGLNNPENPEFVSGFWHATACDPVYPVDDVAYVTLRTGDFTNCPGDENALIVLDISTIQAPQEVQEITMSSPYGMTLINDLLYVGEGANGLRIFDVTDRKKPVQLTHDKSVTAYDVIAHPTKSDVLLIAGPDGLSQYQIDGDQSMDLLNQIGF